MLQTLNLQTLREVSKDLRIVFERVGIKNLEDSIVGLNVDGASVNICRKKAL